MQALRRQLQPQLLGIGGQRELAGRIGAEELAWPTLAASEPMRTTCPRAASRCGSAACVIAHGRKEIDIEQLGEVLGGRGFDRAAACCGRRS